MSTAKIGTYFCKLILRGLGIKATEIYPLGPLGARIDAVNIGINIAKARRLILAAPFQIQRASIHSFGGKRDRSLVQNGAADPLNVDTEAGPPIAIESTNDKKSCLLLQMETAGGDWSTRPISFLRDTWIAAGNLQFVPTPYTAPLIPGTHLVAGLTKENAMGNFIGVIRDYVKLYQRDPLVTGNVDILSLPNFTLLDVSSRDRGATAGSPRGRQRVLANI